MGNWEISCFGWNGITGVYCVCEYVNGKNKIHYIGSSINIGNRLKSLRHPYRILCDSNRCIFIKFKETTDFLNLEKHLIKRLSPEMNSNYVKRY